MGPSRQARSRGPTHCRVAPWAVSSNCSPFFVAVKRSPSAKKGECCVVFFVLLFYVNFLQGVSNGCLGRELTWGHGALSASPQPLALLLAGGGGLVSPPRPTQPGLSSDLSSWWVEGPCSHRAFASCFLFYRKGVLVFPDGLAPQFCGVTGGGLTAPLICRSSLRTPRGTPLVVQWLRLCLPAQGTRV